MAAVEIELAGNELCLDFANTVNSRRRPIRDYIATYADLRSWSILTGSLPERAINLLDPVDPAGPAVLARARKLRDTVYAVFSAIAAGAPPRPSDIESISVAYAAALAHVTIVGTPTGYELYWAVGRGDHEAPLWPVAHSAGELLVGGNLARVGECPGCGWLFRDTSRNGTRRWCSMATCGSRDKMARYHRNH